MNNNNDDSWSRRKFIATSAAAGVTIAMAPSFLTSCGGPATPPSNAAALAGNADSPTGGYFRSFGVDDQLIGKVLNAAMGRGGEYADLFFQHEVTSYLGLEDGEVNQAYSNIKLGCGVRVLKGDQTGFAFTEDLSPEALTSAAMTAAVVADGPAAPALKTIQRVGVPQYHAVEIPWTDVGIEKKMPMLERANMTAMAYDNRVIKVRVFTGDSTSHVMVADSNGKIVEDNRPMTIAYLTCVAQDGERREENYHSFGRRVGFEFYSDARMDELANRAAKKTITLFNAEQPPAGEYPVVLAPGLSGILLHEAIGHGMEADFNRKGKSVYADRIGKPIAPDFVTIVDDGTNQNERGTLNVDDEGNESQRTVLVENGILKSYMHDKISAAHYGVKPTGNGRRQDFSHPPVPRMRNTYMVNGTSDPAEIIASVKKGIYAETFTNGQVRIGSGDFSFYLKNGYVIENGKLGRPVKDANLIGFGPKVLENVEMVGNDLELNVGAGTCGKDGQRVPVGMGLPTVKCGGISVGGVNDG